MAAASPDTSVSSSLRDQWTNPSDILSILLIVGADVVKAALAQFNGQYFKPVPFSFGWVAYSYSYLLTTVGGLKSMPEAEFPCLLINCSTGKIWDKTSWLLGRIMDCYEDIWMPNEVMRGKQQIWDIIEEHETEKQMRIVGRDDEREDRLKNKKKNMGRMGLAVAIFHPVDASRQGVPKRDYVVFVSIATTIIQFAIAAVPCGLYREWEILAITVSGTILAWLMGFLQERAASTRKNTRKSFILTKGSGYGHAVLIVGNGAGLDLDDLANEVSFRQSKTRYRLSIAVDLLLVVLWTALLVTTSGMKSNTWYLVCIGGIGMLQNIFIAGARRHPSAYGIHLRLHGVMSGPKTMEVLKALELEHPNAGRHLLPVMFPGPLRPEESRWWAHAEDRSWDAADHKPLTDRDKVIHVPADGPSASFFQRSVAHV